MKLKRQLRKKIGFKELNEDKAQIQKMKRLSELMGGGIAIGNDRYSTQDLKECVSQLDSMIAVLRSNNQLRKIK